MVQVLGKNGQLLSTTTRYGKVRRLLKEGKAKVVEESPFTIQLLYETKDFNEDFNMKPVNKDIVVISDDSRKPSFPSCKVTVITSKEFIAKATEDDYAVDGEIWVDVDSISNLGGLYAALKPYLEYDFIKFFRYSEHPIVKETIFTLEEDKTITVPIPDQIKVDFKNGIVASGPFLICGKVGSGKTVLSKNICKQLDRVYNSPQSKHKIKIDYFSFIPVFSKAEQIDSINAQMIDTTNLDLKLEEYYKEMMDRFGMLEKAGVTNINELNKDWDYKVFVIDGLADYLLSNEYRSVDRIKYYLSSMARLCRPTGISFILSCQRPLGSVISTELMENITTKIITGRSDAQTTILIFGTYASCDMDIKPMGEGIVGTNNVYGLNKFNVDDVV